MVHCEISESKLLLCTLHLKKKMLYLDIYNFPFSTSSALHSDVFHLIHLQFICGVKPISPAVETTSVQATHRSWLQDYRQIFH